MFYKKSVDMAIEIDINTKLLNGNGISKNVWVKSTCQLKNIIENNFSLLKPV